MKDYLILAYHRVLPSELALKRGIISVTLENFEKQIKYFKDNDWDSLSLEEFHFTNSRKPSTYKKLIITFDDGYRDNYMYAFPILQKYNFKATIFLTAGYLNTEKNLFFGDSINYEPDMIDNILTYDEILEMSSYGIEFGSHTVNHPKLAEIKIEKARYEIEESKKIIEKYLNKEITSFCYPYGNLNNSIIEIVKNADYKIGVVTPSRPGIEFSNFTFRRTGIYLKDSMLKFQIKNSKLFYGFRESNFWFKLKGGKKN